MARKKCSTEAWLFGADLKMQLLELWFRNASQQAQGGTERELEAMIGAKGPKALSDMLQRLIAIGLVKETDSRYEPVPWSELPRHLQDVRQALEIMLPALRQVASPRASDL